jgi:BNR repeat-containing family member
VVAVAVLLAGLFGTHLGSQDRDPAPRYAVRARVSARNDPCPPGSAVRVAATGQIGRLGRGSWSWFADPRAVVVDHPYDETVAGWIDWHGNVTVGALDPGCGVEQLHVVGHLFHDDHGAPAILVEPDGRLTVFWSGHNGQMMDYRTTLRPGDLRGWGPVRRIRSGLRGALGFTYPNPVLLAGERDKLYLFWRGADWSADYATRGLDGGWGPARKAIHNPGQRPYVKVASNGSDTIALAFTDGHPRELKTSIYYVAYRDGWLRHANGRPIARLGSGPIRPRQADLVYNAAKDHVAAWVWDVALDSRGRPVIVYATFPSIRNQAYWYADWNGKRWLSHFMTFAGPSISPGTVETDYSAGIALDHADPSIVYLSRKTRGSSEIEKWVTANGGYSWRHSTAVRAEGVGNVRPVVPWGAGSEGLGLLWLRGRYGSYTTYRTSIAYLR